MACALRLSSLKGISNMKKSSGGKAKNSATKRSVKAQTPPAPTAHPFETRLRAVVNTFGVVNALTTPLLISIKNLLTVAANSFNCDEASIIVRDGDDGSLKFLYAIGEVAQKVMHVGIPPGKGIAGFVFESGQPMAVGDVSHESSFYRDVDTATGYSTQTLLATPLLVDGQPIGVMEFVNRLEGPPFQPFSADEMDRASYFAAAIAPLVAAHERAGLIESLFERALTGALTGESKQADGGDELRQWLDGVRAAPEHRDLLLLADLLREVAESGEAERKLCRGMLENLAAFIKQGADDDGRHTFLS